MTVFAGPREDPFFIHLFGDASLTSVLNAAFSAALGTQVGDPNEQTFAFADPASDDLAGANVLAIVVEVPKSAVASALGITTSDTFYAWATTSVKD
jgi:type IV secretory pathway VirB10-like protein